MDGDKRAGSISPLSEIEITTATYNQIAGDFAARWSDPSILADARARFAALLAPRAWVLDVGCGPARDAAALRALGLRVCGLDRSPGMLMQARRQAALPVILADMRSLPLRDAALDGLWVAASFLHVPKRSGPATLREFRRVLRQGGALYIGVKEGDGERWVALAERSGRLSRFFAFYQAPELDDLLAAAGFAIRDGWLGEGRPERWLSRIAVAGASAGGCGG